MEKASPPSSQGHASLYHASNPANPSDIEYAFTVDQASTIDQAPVINHSFGIDHAPDNAYTGPDDEAPPAYHQVSIEGGNISAEVMRNGRISMLIDSSARIPERVPTFVSQLSQVPEEKSPNYVESEYPVLNIVIQVVGSRGDVQPFVALGKELQRSGHRIRLATHDAFESFVRSAGLDFFPIGGDPEQLMAYMVNNPGIVPKFASIRDGELSRKRKMVFEMLEGCWRSCIEPDSKTNRPFVAEAIIANPPSFAHMHCAQALGIPVHLMFTMPWTPTRAFPHPLANIQTSAITDKRTSNFLSYGLVELMTWQGLSDIINTWRKNSLSLEPIRAMMGAGLADYLHVPFTYCWSPSLVPKPKDWASNIDVCGFFFRDPPDYTPPPELEAFLKDGPAPIYIGFGSIVMDNPEKMSQMILEAVREARVRALVSRGWSKLGTGIEDPNIFFLDDCPHEWLFQRVTAVIHHGGAGTTACGLLNGRPTAVVPFFGDQHFWGRMVSESGAGPDPIEHKLLTPSTLVSAIRFCLTPSAQAAAQKLDEKMSSENGVKEAVESFHRNLPIKQMQCDLLPRHAAVWKYTVSPTQTLKLSDEAAFILMEQQKVNMNNITVYQCKTIEIENNRWDPLSAGGSTLLDTVMGLRSDGKSMVASVQKAQTLKRENSDGASSGTGAATVAVGKGMGRIGAGLAKSVMLDLPVAVADGFHALPVLYGDKKMQRGAVKDWKSGMKVGGKSLGKGFFDGFTGIVTDPIRGAADDGAVGFARGFITGTLGVLFKPGAAMLGFVGYPLLGVYKSISSMNATPAERKILLARQIQGSEVGRTMSKDGSKTQMVLSEFERVTEKWEYR